MLLVLGIGVGVGIEVGGFRFGVVGAGGRRSISNEDEYS